MRYDVVFVVNPKDVDYINKFDGEEYIVLAKKVTPLFRGIAEHFALANPSLEIYPDQEIANVRLEQFLSGEVIEPKVVKSAKVKKVELKPEPIEEPKEIDNEESNSGFRESGDKVPPKPKDK
jgi:hypothetical protein